MRVWVINKQLLKTSGADVLSSRKKNSEKTQIGVETTPLYVRCLIIYKLIAMAEIPGWKLKIASREAAPYVDITRKVFTKLKTSHYIS